MGKMIPQTYSQVPVGEDADECPEFDEDSED